MASSLWRVMQLIEANRHWAEQLEISASTADPAVAARLADIAHERREFADKVYDLFQRNEAVPAG